MQLKKVELIFLKNVTLIVLIDGMQMKWLKPGDKPEAMFKLADGEVAVAAYEYCNLHGLWKVEA